MDTEPLIEVAGLAKTFGGVKAIDGIDFAVPKGELFGFLGPNGAGKTTGRSTDKTRFRRA